MITFLFPIIIQCIMLFGLIPDEPEVPLNVHAPVICVWKVHGERKEKTCTDLKSGRAYAIRVIGGDDRREVRIYDKKTKAKRGKISLFAGQPYWQYNGTTHSLTDKGELLRDWFDY